MMRILHVNNIVNVAWTFSRAQRKTKLRSDVLVLSPSSYGFQADFTVSKYHVLSRILFFKFFRNFLSDYDLYHFHYNSFLPRFMDIPLWKFFGKKVFVHYHGSDIRGKRRYLPRWFADNIFVSTPDLLEYINGAIWIPNPLDLENFPFTGCRKDARAIKIVHATTSRMKKGTSYIVKAISKLRREGYNVELVLIEKTPHTRALEYYKQADIAIDQLEIGWYGMFAIECMALGKPVCVYIREDLESYMPFIPFINTSSRNLAENLRLLVEDEEMRVRFGEMGREYVSRVHDAFKVTKRLTRFYDK